MIKVIKRLFIRIFKSLLSDYGPTALTIVFALVRDEWNNYARS